MSYLFTSESVSEGHPDKIADQISDAIVDEYLRLDSNAKVACETLVTTGKVIISGEVHPYFESADLDKIVRNTIRQIGYTKKEYNFDADSVEICDLIGKQSSDIRQGVDREESEIGAGDQGIIFGYATDETDNFMPLGLDLANKLLKELAHLRREGKEIPYLRPDSKSQVTIEYGDDHRPIRIRNIVLSTQHDEFRSQDEMQKQIREDIINILVPRVMDQCDEEVRSLFSNEILYHINPTGNFVIGGPDGDTGLTGRKIIVDTYGGKGAHGGGAFSGKDPTKVDRSAAYAGRHLARNMVAAGVSEQMLIQIAYAIGEPDPVSFYVNTFGTAKIPYSDGEIAAIIREEIDMRPRAIINRLNLRQPIYFETAAYGHMGRNPGKKVVDFGKDGQQDLRTLETFTWEKNNLVDVVQRAFDLK